MACISATETRRRAARGRKEDDCVAIVAMNHQCGNGGPYARWTYLVLRAGHFRRLGSQVHFLQQANQGEILAERDHTR